MTAQRIRPWFAGLLALGVLAGCGSDNPLGRKAISGNVTLDDEPLDQGNISFQPVNEKGSVPSGSVISAGVYSIPEQKGLPLGKYVVRIHAAAQGPSGTPSSPDDQMPAPGAELPAEERIPPEYNVRSEIIREVTADGDNRFDFDIKTQ